MARNRRRWVERLTDEMAFWGWRCRHAATAAERAVAWKNYLALHRGFWAYVDGGRSA